MKLLLAVSIMLIGCNRQVSPPEKDHPKHSPKSVPEKKSAGIESHPNDVYSSKPAFIVLEKPYSFEKYSVTVYKGKLADPDFRTSPYSTDREFVDFITKGCRERGVNFAGCYTLIERDCGAECLHFFVVNRKSGQILNNLKPNDGRYGYAYQPNSNLLIANAFLFIDSTFQTYYRHYRDLKPEFYEWKHNKTKRLE